jgi:hypothetical protein
VPNTCKSNEELLVIYYLEFLSGERVSNALVTCPEAWDNSGKLELIPHVVTVFRNPCLKDFGPLREGPASHQLVGKVMAYQGKDG